MENWQTPGMTRFINKKKGCEKMTYIFSQPSFLMGDTPCGRGGSEGAKGAKGPEGGSGRLFGNMGEPV